MTTTTNAVDPRSEAIRAALEAAFHPDELSVEDEGAQHRGHAGEGGGHFAVRIVSTRFDGLTAVARHRLVYEALRTIPVHALRISAVSPHDR